MEEIVMRIYAFIGGGFAFLFIQYVYNIVRLNNKYKCIQERKKSIHQPNLDNTTTPPKKL